MKYARRFFGAPGTRVRGDASLAAASMSGACVATARRLPAAFIASPPLRDAVVSSCRIRLRPIVMTSLATIIGLVPMALKLGTGSEAYAPLARAIIGGLIVSVVLTVFIVPAAYLIVYRRRPAPAREN